MEFRPYYLGREWIKLGHNVLIIAASFSHLRTRQPRCEQTITSETIDGIRYFWLRTPGYTGNSWGRIINMLSFSTQILLRNVCIFKPDIIIDSSTYPLTIFGCSKIARKYNAKLIFEVHDLWPLTPVELGGYPRFHPFIIFLEIAERYAYKNSYKVISILPDTKTYMVKHGMHGEKFIYIPNGINLSEWERLDQLTTEYDEFFNELRIGGKFIIGYTGNLGLANAVDSLLKAAVLLRDSSEIHFVIVGDGILEAELKSFAASNNLKNVTFLPSILKKYIPKILSLMDCVYIGAPQKKLYRFGASPNKLLEYMMAGKPIIYAIGTINDPVKAAKCGISVTSENPEAIASAVKQLMRMSDEQRREMGLRGKRYVMENHDYKVLARRFLESIE